jgi:Zn-dependent hydrolases, including glyoxylases
MGYYKVKEIFQNTYSIFDPIGVGSTLIVGSNSGLLIDTCYGFMNMRPTIKKLCPHPVAVVNTHGHFDHIGGNNQFEKVYLSEKDFPILELNLSTEYTKEIFQFIKKQYPISKLLFLYFKLQKFKKYNTQYLPLKDRMSFDLGGRVIETIPFPGHSNGSIILMDKMNQAMFVGDTINQSMFFFTNPEYKVTQYIAQLEQLSNISGYMHLYISHGKDPLPFEYIRIFADFLKRIDISQCQTHNFPTQKNVVYEYKEAETEFGSPISALLDSSNL